jgi:hypothetical protein
MNQSDASERGKPQIGKDGQCDPAHLNVSAEAVREELQKIISSQEFRSSPHLRNFLQYVVEETLHGRADRLKEYAIGVEVFKRGDSFDPRIDTIVRTEARRLRLRLAEYYAA